MAKLIEHTDNGVFEFQRDLARYLVEFEAGRDNIYCQFLRAFGANVVYASLNYDLLLEESAEHLGLGVYYKSTKRPGYVNIVKPHGSCNFWPDAALGKINMVGSYGNGGADLRVPLQALPPPDARRRCRNEVGMGPAIAQYAKGKRYNVTGDLIDHQQAAFQDIIRRASGIGVIGVRVHQADGHIWGELAETAANLWYVGFDKDRAAFDVWKADVGKSNAYFIESDFEGCIGKLYRRMFGRRSN